MGEILWFGYADPVVAWQLALVWAVYAWGGFLIGCFGLGGGLFFVPALLFLPGMKGSLAVGTVFVASVPISVCRMTQLLYYGKLNCGKAWPLLAPAASGSLLGQLALAFVPSYIVAFTVAALAVFAGVQTQRRVLRERRAALNQRRAKELQGSASAPAEAGAPALPTPGEKPVEGRPPSGSQQQAVGVAGRGLGGQDAQAHARGAPKSKPGSGGGCSGWHECCLRGMLGGASARHVFDSGSSLAARPAAIGATIQVQIDEEAARQEFYHEPSHSVDAKDTVPGGHAERTAIRRSTTRSHLATMSEWLSDRSRQDKLAMAFVGLLASFISSLGGVGGPIIFFPLWLLWDPDMPMKQLVGLSSPFAFCVVVSAAVGALSFGEVDLGLALVLTTASTAFTLVGGMTMERMADSILKLFVGGMLIIVGLVVTLKTLLSLIS